MSSERPTAQGSDQPPSVTVINNSEAVQVGDHNFFLQILRGPHKREWLVGIALGVTLTLVGVLLLIIRTVPKADLELSSFAVQKPSKVNAKQHSVGELNGAVKEEVLGHEPIDATAVDIMLKNNGNSPAVLLGADVTVLYAQQLEDCNERGGEVTVAAEYSVTLPKDMPPTPFVIPRDIRFEVRGGVTDRFTLSIGPDEQTKSSTSPWVIVAEVNLRKDDGSGMRAGTAGLVTFPGEGLANLSVSPLWNRDCIRKNAQRVRDALAVQSDARADELVELGARFAALEASPGVAARESCDSQSQGQIVKLCAILRQDKLEIRLTLARRPEVGRTALSVEVLGSGGAPQYVQKLVYDYGYQAVAGWHVEADTSGGSPGLSIPEDGVNVNGTTVTVATLSTVDLVLKGKADVVVTWAGQAPQERAQHKVTVTRGA